MGEILNVDTNLIRPTQNYLEQVTIDYYKNRYGGKSNSLPVPVMIDLFDQKFYRAIDGPHNLAVSHNYFGCANLWVIESPRDFMTRYTFPNVNEDFLKECNKQIRRRFQTIPFYVPTNNNGEEILNLDQLIKENKIELS